MAGAVPRRRVGSGSAGRRATPARNEMVRQSIKGKLQEQVNR